MTDKEINLLESLSQVTLNIIGAASFNYNFNALEAEDSLSSLFANSIASLRPSILSFLLGRFARAIPTSATKQRKELIDGLNASVDQIIKNERKQHQTMEFNQKKARNILSLLFDAKDNETGLSLTDAELRDEVKTFVIAGHETTSTLLCWVFYCLAQNPQVEVKLLQEVDSLNGQLPSPEELDQKLPYLNNVIKEVLRLYPPVPFVVRNATADEILAGYKIPKGTRIVIPAYLVHRSPNYWENPTVFDPNRWNKSGINDHQPNQELDSSIESSSTIKHPYAYLPFIHGIRNCIGQRFAILESKIILLTVLQHMTVKLVDGHPPIVPQSAITMKPKPPLLVNVFLRNNSSIYR